MNDSSIKLPHFEISYVRETDTEYRVTTSASLVYFVRSVYDNGSLDWVESFYVLALDRANNILGYKLISRGGITGTVADPRVVMQFALLTNAVNIIITHNHPSGSLLPSEADDTITEKIVGAAKMFDIKVLDHIIISRDGYYSFADEGRL